MKADKKPRKADEQIQNLIKFVFRHINNLPQQKIRQAVILVSVHNGMLHVYKKLANPNLKPDQQKQPLFQLVGDQIPLIYPTEAFLNPQQSHNFVSMHYLLNKVTRAKFIFSFKHADLTQTPMNNVKQTLTNFVSLFEKSLPNIGSELSQSCGYIINEAKKQGGKASYISILQALHKESGYISKEQVKNLARQSIIEERVVLFQVAEQKNLKKPQQMFSDLVRSLKYFELPSKIEPAIFSAERDYISSKIHEIWHINFKKLYHNLQILITQTKSEEQNFYPSHKNADRGIEDSLADISQKCIPKEIWQKPLEIKVSLAHKTLRLSLFIQTYLKIISQITSISNQPYEQSQDIVVRFMKSLVENGYIIKYQIYMFFVSFFKIQNFLRNCTNQLNQKLIEKVNFKQEIMDLQIIDQKMTFLINYLYSLFDQDLSTNFIVAYPFVQLITSITSILEILRVNKYGFATERTFKKLAKYKAELAFKRASLATEAYNIPKKEIRDSWIEFLEYSLDSTLIQPSKLERALSFLAEELTKNKSTKLALDVYSYLPEYKSYKKIIAIYERDLKFNPQIMKYTLSFDWPNKRESFQDYCKFLLKIGFNEQVRQLCLEGLKVIDDDEEGIQLLKGLLISARGEQSRDIHNGFLHDLNEEQIKIKIDKQLLQKLKHEFSKK